MKITVKFAINQLIIEDSDPFIIETFNCIDETACDKFDSTLENGERSFSEWYGIP